MRKRRCLGQGQRVLGFLGPMCTFHFQPHQAAAEKAAAEKKAAEKKAAEQKAVAEKALVDHPAPPEVS